MRYKLVISELTQYDYNGTLRDTTKTVYEQEIENLDIRAIIACANNLAAPLPEVSVHQLIGNLTGKDISNG